MIWIELHNLNVEDPETAKCPHKYENGQKINYDVYPDLSQSSRQANFKAIQYKRMRLMNSLNNNV